MFKSKTKEDKKPVIVKQFKNYRLVKSSNEGLYLEKQSLNIMQEPYYSFYCSEFEDAHIVLFKLLREVFLNEK